MDQLSEVVSRLDGWCSSGRGRQARIARELGVSEGLIHDWRKGRRLPAVNQFLFLRDFLKRKKN